MRRCGQVCPQAISVLVRNENERFQFFLIHDLPYGPCVINNLILVKIEYFTGNRPPVAKAGVVDSVGTAEKDKKVFLTSERAVPPAREAVGENPLRVLFTSRGTNDPDDNDTFSYEWLFDGKTVGSRQANPSYTFSAPGT